MSVGRYCKVEVLVGGASLVEHKVPGQTDPYVEAVYGSPYTIRIHNMSHIQVAVSLYIDGTQVGPNRLINARGLYDLSDILTRSEVRGGVTNDYYDKIVFATPEVSEERKGAAPSAEELGKIEVKVHDLVPCTPRLIKASTGASQPRGSILKNLRKPTSKTKDGLFKATTSTGETSRVEATQANANGMAYSSSVAMKSVIETLRIRLGLHVYHIYFMHNSEKQDLYKKINTN